MTWDTTTPADDEKIRKLGTVGRAHWDAIQDADLDGAPFLLYRALQMADRTDLGVAEDPTVAASTAYIYSKNDEALAAGKQELFIRDAASNIMQVTNDGALGSTATKLQADSVSFDGTRTYNENNIVVAWGYVSSAGVLQYGEGIGQGGVTITLSDTSLYNITFTTGVLTTTDYAVVAMASSNINAAWGTIKTTSNYDIRTRSTTDGAKKASTFYFMVVGGQ